MLKSRRIILNGINNNFNYQTQFHGTKERTSDMQKDENIMDEIANRMCEVLSQRAEREVPQNGKFSKISVSCAIPETQNKARVIIEHDPIEPKNLRRLSVASFRMGSDRLVSSYILKGTKQEIIDYINSPVCAQKVSQLASQLSDSVDKYYNENF